ncbi:hypothetical protein CFP56_020437 [Quercus suber]|uniref:Uncharacterized protein n=1 Tax=Quercus suber TaxID=58331 RepID=A0AAW0M0A5_QUESU
MDDHTGKWARLSLNTQESQTVPLAFDVENNSRTLKSMWHLIHDFELRDLGSNTVLILFSSEVDSLKILA